VITPPTFRKAACGALDRAALCITLPARQTAEIPTSQTGEPLKFGGLFLSKDDPENETGVTESEPEMSRLGAIGLVAAMALLTALMGALVYVITGLQ
jgi:hypothetical protein